MRETFDSRYSILVATTLVLFGLYLFKLWPPYFPGANEGDATHIISVHHLFGTKFFEGLTAFHTTGGAWAVLRWPFFLPDAFYMQYAADILFCSILAFLIVYWMSDRFNFSIFNLVMVFIAFQALSRVKDGQMLMASFLFVFMLAEKQVASRAVVVLTVVFMAWASTIKGTALLVTYAIAGAAAIDPILKKKIPYESIAVVVLSVGIFLARGVSPAEFLDYFQFIMRATAGYAEQFSEPGTFSSFLIAILMAGFYAIFFMGFVLRRNGEWHFGLCLSLLLVLVILLKTGFVRADGQHVQRTLYTYVAIIVFHLSYLLSRNEVGLARWGGAALDWFRGYRLASVAGLAAALIVASFWFRPAWWQAKWQQNAGELAAIGSVLRTGKGDFVAQYRRYAADAIEMFPVLEGIEKAAILSNRWHHVLIARGMEIDYPPILTFNETYSPKEARIFHSFLTDEKRSDTLIIPVLSFPPHRVSQSVFENYVPVAHDGRLMRLRASEPRPLVAEPVWQGNATPNSVVRAPLPAGKSLLRVKADFELTALSRLLVRLLRGPEVHVSIRCAGEREPLLSARDVGYWMVRDGLLIPPPPEDDAEKGFAYFMDPTSAGVQCDALEIDLGFGADDDWLFRSDRWRWFVKPDIAMAVERLQKPVS